MAFQYHFTINGIPLIKDIVIGEVAVALSKVIINANLLWVLFYQSPLILTELFQHSLINVSYLTACYLYQVMMTLHFLNDVANDAESTQKSKITS